ncbi:hypothetical protein RsoM2USA_332 [Ralstonia phage RsoM2USA]|nr:hypothetical protein RsoM2USA_332 [Ralstonia phage RsoM2USA]
MKLREIASYDIMPMFNYLKQHDAILSDRTGGGSKRVSQMSDISFDKDGTPNFAGYQLSLQGNDGQLDLPKGPPEFRNLIYLELTSFTILSWDELPTGLESLYMGMGHLPNPANIPSSIKYLSTTDTGFAGSLLPLFDGRIDEVYISFVGDDGFVELTYKHGSITAGFTPDSDALARPIIEKLDSVFEFQDWMISHNLEHMI